MVVFEIKLNTQLKLVQYIDATHYNSYSYHMYNAQSRTSTTVPVGFVGVKASIT